MLVGRISDGSSRSIAGISRCRLRREGCEQGREDDLGCRPWSAINSSAVRIRPFRTDTGIVIVSSYCTLPFPPSLNLLRCDAPRRPPITGRRHYWGHKPLIFPLSSFSRRPCCTIAVAVAEHRATTATAPSSRFVAMENSHIMFGTK